MKKFVSLLLALVMAFSLVACGGSETPVEDQSSASQIVYGVTNTMAGDLGFGQWSSVGGDKPVYSLIDAYAPTCYDQNGQWVWDETVVASHDIADNDDGTKTYTVTIKEGLKFSDGSAITAKNYVAYPLLFTSPAAVAKEAYGRIAKEFVGQEAYKDGSADTFAGLRLIDEYTFAIDVAEKYSTYYYGLALLNFSPISYQMWLDDDAADVADDGNGCYFVTSQDFTPENYGEKINNGRFIYTNRVCSGPYYLESLDVAANEAVLRVNTNYLGNFEGQKPSIETIIVKSVNAATMLDQLKKGEIDLIDNIGDGDIINACFDLADEGGFQATNYPYAGMMMLFMQCDWGPVQFLEVRQALTYLTNREAICQEATQGYGNVINSQYAFAQWMAQAKEEELNSELEAYAYSLDKAVEVLKAGGWVYNADGSDYVDGSNTVRYKKVTAEQAAYNDGIMDGCVPFEGGYLMPLHLKYIGHAEGDGAESTLNELLTIYLLDSDTTVSAGMTFEKTATSDAELLSYLNRRGTDGEDVSYQSYNVFSLISGLSGAKFDESGGWQEGNLSAFWDDDLENLADTMTYGTEPGDDESYLNTWMEYQKVYNAKLPGVPLYNCTFCAVYNDKLQNYEETSIWTFQYAILYATVQ